MALKQYNPTTPSQRGLVLVDKSALWKGKPVKALTEGKRKSGGRNNKGHVTSRGIAGGHKQKYRYIDFTRRKWDVEGTVERLEYDPNRTAFIALVSYGDGEQAYIIAPQRLGVGDKRFSLSRVLRISFGLSRSSSGGSEGLNSWRDQILERVRADDLLPFGPAGHELVDPGGGPVVDGHGVAAALDVQDEVLAHDGQADQADVCGAGRGGHGVDPDQRLRPGSDRNRRPIRGEAGVRRRCCRLRRFDHVVEDQPLSDPVRPGSGEV